MFSIKNAINSYSNGEKVILVLLYATVGSLPLNIFKVWRLATSYWQGHFIDYWAPKIYLSELLVVLLCLASLWWWWQTKKIWALVQNRPRLMPHFRLQLSSIVYLLIVGGGVFTIIRSLLAPESLAALSWWLGIGCVLALGYWLHIHPKFQRQVWQALVLTGLGQSIVVLYQFWTQSPLLPHRWLGEPQFRSFEHLAMSQFFSSVRYLPYGTTPHPNVAAAWLVVTLLVTMNLGYRWWSSQHRFTWVNWAMAVVGIMQLMALFATESLAAGLTLGVLSSLWIGLKWLGQRQPIDQASLAIGLLVGAGLLFSMTIGGLLLISQTAIGQSPSIQRRVTLLQAGEAAVPHYPWGTGANRHMIAIPYRDLPGESSNFWQPVHNVPLILVLEFGYCTILLFILFILIEHKFYTLSIWLLWLCLPFSLLDHFLVTTISGQFLGMMLIIFLQTIMLAGKPITGKLPAKSLSRKPPISPK
jgi:hypothetical protein